ncbi:hypothetical protein OG592_43155 (plasmid) [Streptomyces avidinii]|uniref:hypothetical protein n=1 Tax=Streptomyces avidinii TaxID=1895 RepID=UPI002F916589|nr:hypothetical protein OG592_43155 [Streptomyces avidinii]
MRTRLLTAVRAVLADPALAGARDSVLLAAVVLLAKSPASSPAVLTRARELARWSGYSKSYVDHHVLPALRARGVALSRPTKDGEGQVDGLELTLTALVRARAEGTAHALSLSQRELATFLRLVEAVFGPGWAPKGAPETPPGLLGGRQGPGAASERLVLLLLVLLARPNGRVVMAPGSVAAGHGRAAATVARQLGCELEDAQRIVGRLEAAGLVEVHGEGARERLVVPAVASAHRAASAVEPAGRIESPPAAEDAGSTISGCVHCEHCAAGSDDGAGELSGEGFVQDSLDDVLGEVPARPVGALRVCSDVDEADEAPATYGATGVEQDSEADSYVGAGALLHTDHPDVVTADASSDGDLECFSGSAVSGCSPLPDRARAGEDAAEVKSSAEGSSCAGQGPLRGDKPPAADGGVAAAGGPAWLWAQGSAAVPRDLGVVLEPVESLWSRLVKPGTQRWLAGLVRGELDRVVDLVGRDRAVRVLAGRLERRLGELFGAPVTDPVAWMVGRGLPQRPGCWSVLCDDGHRMNTGLACDSCEAVVGDRRELRARIRSEVAAELAGLGPGERRAEVERRLNLGVQRQAAMDLIRRERSAAEAALRLEAVERRRAELAAQQAERASQPCADCGIAEASGLCLGCTAARGLVEEVRRAVAVAVAMRADLTDHQAVRELSARIEADTLASAAAGAENVGDPAVRAFARLSAVRRIRAQRTGRALYRLEQGSVADAAAKQARWAFQRRASQYASRAELLEAMSEAEAKARATAARELLDGLLADVRRATPHPVGRPHTDWAAALSDLAHRPLPGEGNRGDAGPVESVGALVRAA